MKILNKSSEDEVIALFFKGELTSKRFSKELLKIISNFNVNLNIISSYDLKITRKISNSSYIEKIYLKSFDNFKEKIQIIKNMI
jgi:hypothetical protein